MPFRDRLRRTFGSHSIAPKPSSPSTTTTTSSTSITLQHLARFPSNLPSSHFVAPRAPPPSPAKGTATPPSPCFRNAFPPAATTATIDTTMLKRSVTNPVASTTASKPAAPSLVRSLSQRAATTSAATTTLLGRPLKRTSSKQNSAKQTSSKENSIKQNSTKQKSSKATPFAKPAIVSHTPAPGPPTLKPSTAASPTAVKPAKPSRKQRKALEKTLGAEPPIPRLKYRAVVDRQHMAALRAYSIADAFATARPRSVWSGVSPRATRKSSLGSTGSMSTRRGSWEEDGEAGRKVDDGGDGANVRHSFPVPARPPHDRLSHHPHSTAGPLPPITSPLSLNPPNFRYSCPVTATYHVDAGRVDAPLPAPPRTTPPAPPSPLPHSPSTPSFIHTPPWFTAPASAVSTKRTSRTGPPRTYLPAEDSFLLFDDHDDDEGPRSNGVTATPAAERERASAYLRPRSRVVERTGGMGRMSGVGGGTGAAYLDAEMDRMLDMLAVGKA